LPNNTFQHFISPDTIRENSTKQFKVISYTVLNNNIPVWEEGNWQPLPSLTGDLSTDVCVIGLGGSGLTCIQELLEHNTKVIGIDAGIVAGGAAGRNGGFLLAGLALSHHEAVTKLGRERAVKLYQATLQELGHIQRATPEAVRQVGSLRIAFDKEEQEDCDLQFKAMRDDGLSVEGYKGKEGTGLLFSQDAAFQPLKRCRLLAHQVLDKGAVLFENSPAFAIRGTTVVTSKGSIQAKKIIVAVDGRLERLLPELSKKVRTARLQMLATAPTCEVSIARPVYRRWGYEYWQQLENKAIALGGFRDHFKEQEWTKNNQPTLEIQGLLEQFLRDKLNIQAEVTHHWAASVSYTENHMPIAEEVRENVWAIGGYCGTGNVVGALCGRALAEHITTGKSEVWRLLKS
jgi:gamma-glutamylputrescine oxidase